MNSSLDVVMWNKSLAEATNVPGDAVESQHISALPFTDEAALEQVCWVRVSLNTACRRCGHWFA